MARIARRRFLKLSGSGAVAAPYRRPRGHPGQRTGTGLGAGDDRPLAALGRFRAGLRRAAQGPDRAGMQEGARHQPQARDGQRQRPAVAHHLGDPVGRRRRHHHGDRQLAAALRRQPGRRRATWPRRSARPRAATTTSAKQVATVGNKWIGVPFTIGGGLIAYRKSWFEEVGLHDLPRDLGHLPRGRQEAEGQGAADRPDRRATPSATRRAGGIRSLWSWGGKEVEADGKTVVAEQQGNCRVDQVRGRPVEGDHGRGRARLGRHQQQPRLPVADHQRHQQRRLDLHRSQEEAGDVPDREGHADVEGHPARAVSPRGRAASTTCRARSPTC